MDLPIFYNEEEEWKKVMLRYDSALKEVSTKLEILNNEFKLAHQYNPIEHITSRIKTPQSIAKKMRHNEKELTVENIVKYINDVAGIRVICSFTSDIYRIADLLAKQSDVQVLKVKDYIMCPKSNGYTSYHMIVSVPIFLSNTMVNTKVEIQIRTIAMDFWASLEHKIYYKFEGNAPEGISKELKECADVISFLDQKMLSLNEEIKKYHHDEAVEQYKVILSDSFQDMIKSSYGTVVDEDELETTEQTTIQVTEQTVEQTVEHVAELTVERVEEQPVEHTKEQAEEQTLEQTINEAAIGDKKHKEKGNNKSSEMANNKDGEKKPESKFVKLFGLR